MAIYRNGILQNAYRNGVRQVAYRNGVALTQSLASTHVIDISYLGTIDKIGYQKGNVSSLTPNGSLGYSGDIDWLRIDNDTNLFQFAITRGSPRIFDNTSTVVVRLDNEEKREADFSSTFQEQHFFSTDGNDFFLASELAEDIPLNIGFKKLTGWQPAVFGSTRIGYSEGSAGVMLSAGFMNYRIKALYSNTSSGTSLLSFVFSGYDLPDTSYTALVVQYDNNGNELGRGEFINSSSENWVCEEAFLQDIDGEVTIYLRVLT